ncbi:Growth_factor receptor cysteine-rich domain superfamily [Hexamita inflata]|uniref:Growth factor receptor cysteine-rich domain superfamily n=1 Tax=Hexamita inflata TaxID=28002 RepID=A0AA86U4W7_9EUKA|nr:Growth factor receptor cysteine-rich domain superfamily [Hexamita inflata]
MLMQNRALMNKVDFKVDFCRQLMQILYRYPGSIYQDKICVCDVSQKYVGFIINKDSKCTKCSELLNNEKSECVSCSAVYSEGAVYNINLGKCECDSSLKYGTLQLQTTFRCTKCSELLDLDKRKCKTCFEQYGNGAIYQLSSNKCVCNTNQKYAGALINFQSKCILCTETTSSDGFECQTCLEKYGKGAKEEFGCRCDYKQNYVGFLINPTDTCSLCPELLTDDKSQCQKCTDVYKSGAIFKDGKCQCDETYLYDGLLSESSSRCQKCLQAVNSAQCQTCEKVYGVGAIFDQMCICDWKNNYAGSIQGPNSCQLCPELMNSAKTQCVTCSQLILNTQFNSIIQQCECMQGYKFKHNQCIKSRTNRTVGLAVGIPLAIITIIIVITVIAVKQKKQNANKIITVEQPTQEMIQIAIDDVIQVQQQDSETIEAQQIQ